MDERRQTSKINVESIQLKLEPIDVNRLTNDGEKLKKKIRELNAIIDEIFQGSEDELKLLIANFQRDQDKKKRKLQD
ncbi:unnamed protein product [Rotaria sp. Silwood1]|nr:unnamed protein product [Rotaria sp. Silwood1]CAF1584437.1 unnamed protein product [Rotaria sp. Silwood1]CAF3683412.1 unnamed protein product [Rotaria sp. Silwood1]CAF4913008.1 unnamed protein product [Rotaria sp. Silwood1]CAF4987073.1 unnamed protein product [Rotaria sp. Silwood1]